MRAVENATAAPCEVCEIFLSVRYHHHLLTAPYDHDTLTASSAAGFMLPDTDDAIIWRGPRKNGLIRQFLTDVDWGNLDYLIIDTPPGTSDEHISIVQFLKEATGW